MPLARHWEDSDNGHSPAAKSFYLSGMQLLIQICWYMCNQLKAVRQNFMSPYILQDRYIYCYGDALITLTL